MDRLLLNELCYSASAAPRLLFANMLQTPVPRRRKSDNDHSMPVKPYDAINHHVCFNKTLFFLMLRKSPRGSSCSVNELLFDHQGRFGGADRSSFSPKPEESNYSQSNECILYDQPLPRPPWGEVYELMSDNICQCHVWGFFICKNRSSILETHSKMNHVSYLTSREKKIK